MQMSFGNESVIRIDQSDLVEELLKSSGMVECNAAKTPLETERLKRCDGKCGKNDKVDATLYRGIIGKLNYLASMTRPDLQFCLSYLSQFNSCPHKEHMVAI